MKSRGMLSRIFGLLSMPAVLAASATLSACTASTVQTRTIYVEPNQTVYVEPTGAVYVDPIRTAVHPY